MDSAETEIKEKAALYAVRLLEHARQNEPLITADLQKIAKQVSAGLVGLENKFKSEESLTEKLAGKVKADMIDAASANSLADEAVEKSIKLRAKQNNDSLRYTFLFSSDRYVFGFKQTLTLLAGRDYKAPERRIWNAWKNIGTTFDNGYRGINITIISSQRQKFELQFHTKESFDLKMKTHRLYKQLQSNKVSIQNQDEIKIRLVKMAKEISIPEGVKKL